ncbi:MAG: hypothetical protein ACR2QS_05765 [Woeseiaceae bacterium]
MTAVVSLTRSPWARVCYVLPICLLASFATAQQEEARPAISEQPEAIGQPEPEQPPSIKSDVEAPPASEAWEERVTILIEQKFAFEKDSEDADDLFRKLDLVLHARIHRINERMVRATSPRQPVNLDGDLPAEIVSIEDLHENIRELYAARLMLLEHLSDELHLEVTATDVIGVEQLTLETEYVWEQIHFRTLNLPAALDDLARRIQIAPIPVIWHFIKILLVIAAFRWWRKWFPETLRRMQSYLADIRPRSPAVMRRIRMIWYVDQVRRPLEWMLVTAVLLSMIELEGLNLLVSIIESIVRWVLLGWLAVSMLNAFSARGAAGLSGADESVRLRSLQLIAAWLVLLGLGLDLAKDLAGVATLYAWVWRLFQVLALPVLLILLAWWRQPIFTRLERESESSEPVQRMLQHQKGIRSFGSAANGAFWLLANSLRRSLMRTFLRVGEGHGISLTGSPTNSSNESVATAQTGIGDDVRSALLAGSSGFDKYARTERRRLIRRANNGQSGVIAVVGERGIGKATVLKDVVENLSDTAILLECETGEFAEVERGLCDALSIKSTAAEKIAAAMQKKGTRVVAIQNMQRLSRPIAGGQAELKRLTDLIQGIGGDVLWVLSIDSFTWQFLRRARADQSNIHEIIALPPWTEDQLSALIRRRNEGAGLDPDFSRVQVPSEHAVTSYDTAEERNAAGVSRMLWTISGGNPAVALLIWSNCLYSEVENGDRVFVRLPAQPSVRELDSAAHNVMLVLRCVAQAELITESDIVDNLRLPQGAVGTAMHFCLAQGWIEECDGRYQICMQWFRTITRVLVRQNLLAR